MSPGIELLTRVGKGCRGIHSSPMDIYPSTSDPRVRSLPVCGVGDTSEAEMKSYGLAALAPVANTHPSPPSGGQADPGAPGRRTKAIATANVQSLIPNICLSGPRSSPNFYSSLASSM